ncbi:hypothetical protein [Christiangramia sabulilitoris]|uniref:Uncharacterized protein n=1 Tax=Christiangramia sabulilitoris TaxID=2583991 RepID=A0A550I691_9FLAO|nr:hypothetical protein [Christiangramia sabulilitoris]TRO66481.1 hypothetical protein FGM01_00955 [Christiangramia sabulilitoris]
MSEDKNNQQADWQKNSGRSSNFNSKDEDLKKDGDGNLKIRKENQGLSEEENESIRETLDSLSDEDKNEEEE